MAPNKPGSLTIAGSGIASIGHITLEILAHIKEADKIFYAVTDPATECYIQENSRGDHFDLMTFYDTNKKCYESYVQMAEVMLRDVRAGRNVLAIFYGHPAREEGFQAKMLPGISAEDYMFADFGFDPSTYGCMTQEATELLVRNKKLDPSIHNIIWQVGSVGVDTMVFDSNGKFHLLVERLEKYFGLDHKIQHYIGAILPQSVTVKDTFAIRDLRKEEVLKQFTTTSTFYIPSRSPAPVDAKVVQALGSRPPKPPHWTGYGPVEKQAVATLDSFIPSQEKQVVHASPAMQSLMADLALRPVLLQQYKADPVGVANARNGLTAQEKFALGFKKSGSIFEAMRQFPSAIFGGQEKSQQEIAHAADNKALASVELAATYAALILADDGIEISADKIVTLTNAAHIEVEPIWATLLAKALEGKNVKDLLSNVGSGGGAPAVGGGAAPAAGGAAPAADAPKAEEKEEEKEESDDDMGFGLFD
ncbi:60s acidic ribosomal protein-domain-containing protein [Mycena rosella]|uniref:60s acidic ribosomal protein-domain-containing protein n=1 Tax=Mycena rosella TaxID=1033263 RepID=A0AAD7DHN4_MYCRO|nr:60s acidic ribosomal protein-domain-containing protein [Mycena rosella]